MRLTSDQALVFLETEKGKGLQGKNRGLLQGLTEDISGDKLETIVTICTCKGVTQQPAILAEN